MQRDVVVVSGVRTAIGGFGGSLKDFPPTDLGARVVREALARANVSGDEVGHVVFGNVVHTEPKDMYLARVAAINGGVAQHAPALTVNRLCGSGLQAIVSAAQSVLLGDADIAIGGGAENMSRAPYSMPAARFGQRMGDARLVDMMVGALNDPFQSIHMGVTAENVARKYDLSRNAGCARARIASPCGQRDHERLLQGTDPADRACVEERRSCVRHRRTRAHECIGGRLLEAQAGVREGKRYGDGRQRVGHQRRRRGRRADGA